MMCSDQAILTGAAAARFRQSLATSLAQPRNRRVRHTEERRHLTARPAVGQHPAGFGLLERRQLRLRTEPHATFLGCLATGISALVDEAALELGHAGE